MLKSQFFTFIKDVVSFVCFITVIFALHFSCKDTTKIRATTQLQILSIYIQNRFITLHDARKKIIVRYFKRRASLFAQLTAELSPLLPVGYFRLSLGDDWQYIRVLINEKYIGNHNNACIIERKRNWGLQALGEA